MKIRLVNSMVNVLNLIYITLFPVYFEEYFKVSLAARAIQQKLINFRTYNIRDYATKGRADDYPYGGGGGILIKIEPLLRALCAAEKENQELYIILLCPQGKTFQQEDVKRLAEKKNLTFVCGHYEGFDQRINSYVDEYLSVGNFITAGGEIPSLAITEAVMRAVPGFIRKESFETESFTFSRFDYDSYTRPEVFDKEEVPSVLKSGDHKRIET